MIPVASDLPLPDSVIAMIEGLVGRPLEVTPLGGMSGAEVHRVAGPDGTVVAKGGVSVREVAVYRDLRPILDAKGVRIPVSHGAVEVGGGSWLVLEDVPTSLPRERWLADPEVMAMLGRLHGLPRSLIDALPDPFRPAWTEAMDRSALEWLGGEPDLIGRLAALRVEAAPLFAPLVPISGDPNPQNWGVSVTGELVLMDWERIGLGHPALDVAITIPGLPTGTELDVVAKAYRRSNGRDIEFRRIDDIPERPASALGTVRRDHVGESGPSGPDSPTSATPDVRRLALAKVWTVVEFLAASSRMEDSDGAAPGRRQREMAGALARAVPGWLRSFD